jgi:hypothetical protein
MWCHSLKIGFSWLSSGGGEYTQLSYGTSLSVTYSGSPSTSPSSQIVYDAVRVWLSSRKLTLNALKTVFVFFSRNRSARLDLTVNVNDVRLHRLLWFTSSALFLTQILNGRSTSKQNVRLRNLLSSRPILCTPIFWLRW